MSLKYRYLMAAGIFTAAPLATYAGFPDCSGNMISPGDTGEQSLGTCGNPASRSGSDFSCEIADSPSEDRP